MICCNAWNIWPAWIQTTMKKNARKFFVSTYWIIIIQLTKCLRIVAITAFHYVWENIFITPLFSDTEYINRFCSYTDVVGKTVQLMWQILNYMDDPICCHIFSSLAWNKLWSGSITLNVILMNLMLNNNRWTL